MTVENKHNNKLERLGFSYERGGVHTARTMMLVELRALLSFVDVADAARGDYLEAIQTANCLGKRSGKTRTLTFRLLDKLVITAVSALAHDRHHKRWEPPRLWGRDRDAWKLPSDLTPGRENMDTVK